MIKQTNMKNNVEMISTKSFRHIGEFSKALSISHSKTRKKWKKPKLQSVYAHLQVKQDNSTKEIKVYIRDIMARK